MIMPLPRKHSPTVEHCRLLAFAVTQMPLAKKRSLIPGTAECQRKSPLRIVERRIERSHSINVIVCAGQDSCPARCTDRVGAESRVHPNPLGRNPINIGCVINAAAIGRDSVRRMVVAHDKYDVGTV